MLCSRDRQRVVLWLGAATAVGILWRTVGIDFVNIALALVGHPYQVLRGHGYMTHLVTMAGFLIGGLGADKYITSRNGANKAHSQGD